jgi:hypothetical protein
MLNFGTLIMIRAAFGGDLTLRLPSHIRMDILKLQDRMAMYLSQDQIDIGVYREVHFKSFFPTTAFGGGNLGKLFHFGSALKANSENLSRQQYG